MHWPCSPWPVRCSMPDRATDILDHHVLMHWRAGRRSSGVIWQHEARAERIADVEAALERLRAAGKIQDDRE